MSRNRKCVNGAQSKDITVIDATLEVFLLKSIEYGLLL